MALRRFLIAASCNSNGIKYKQPLIDVQHKIIHKKRGNYLIFVENHWKLKTIWVHYYKCTAQDVFCILIPELLKIKFEIVESHAI
jgi:hypothetical protein